MIERLRDPRKVGTGLDDAQKLQRAQQATHLLENPMLIEAFDKIEGSLLRLWRDTDPGRSEEREQLWHQLRALDVVRAYLTRVVTTGNLVLQKTAASKKADGTAE